MVGEKNLQHQTVLCSSSLERSTFLGKNCAPFQVKTSVDLKLRICPVESQDDARATAPTAQRKCPAGHPLVKSHRPTPCAIYERISIDDACGAGDIGPKQLAVWVNRTGTWTELPDVAKLWGTRGKKSLCRQLVTGLLGMSDAQYDSMKNAFEDREALEPIGIYRRGDNYAIVVRLPKDNKRLLAGVGAAIGAAGLGLGFLSRGGVTFQKKAKWLAAYDLFMKDAHLLHALYQPNVAKGP